MLSLIRLSILFPIRHTDKKVTNSSTRVALWNCTLHEILRLIHQKYTV